MGFRALGMGASMRDESTSIRVHNVTIALIKGVAIALSCRAGKIPCNQICLLTSLEPNKVYLGPNRNNKGVAIISFSLFFRPGISRFY